MGYIPTLREKGNEWISIGVEGKLKATSLLKENLSFVGISEGEVHQVTAHNISDIINAYTNYSCDKLDLIMDIKNIDNKLYATRGNNVFKFIGNQEWTSIFDNEKERKGKSGFIYSLDGFSDDEIYIGGNNGEVWLFNGNTWQELEIPTNEWIPNIVCAPDGNVYLNARGKIIIGRKDNWEKSINTGEAIEK